MTRLVTCGWETGNPDENQSGQAAIDPNWTVVTSSPTPKAPSAYCIVGSGASNATKQWQFAAAKTDIYVRFRLYIKSAVTTGSLFQFLDSAAGLQVAGRWDTNDHFLRVYRGSGTTNLLATSSMTMELNIWHLVEVRWQATSTTAGIVQVWLNGTQVINFSGDNTNTANVNVQTFLINATDINRYYFDDLAINDTAGTVNNGQIGDGSVVLLKPSGAGSNTSQTRGGTDSGANWSQVDELPVSLADYVYSATAGVRDTYALEDLPAGSWSVNCVEAIAYGQNSDTGAGSIAPTVKSGATTNEGAATAMTNANALFARQQYEFDPATSAAWANAAVNALEAGTTVR